MKVEEINGKVVVTLSSETNDCMFCHHCDTWNYLATPEHAVRPEFYPVAVFVKASERFECVKCGYPLVQGGQKLQNPHIPYMV